jgi:glutamate synthase (ferredoxin)
MTGGTIIVLGKTGKNFAAGMSGGIAYVFDEMGSFASLCNREMVELDAIGNETEINFVKDQIFRHIETTGSQIASRIMLDWENSVLKFVRVTPTDYRQMLDAQEEMMAGGLSKEDAEMAAFEKIAA